MRREKIYRINVGDKDDTGHEQNTLEFSKQSKALILYFSDFHILIMTR